MIELQQRLSEKNQAWSRRLRLSQRRLQKPIGLTVEGKLTRMVGLTLEAVGCRAPVGGRCLVESSQGFIEAEVVGFSGERLFLMPTGDIRGLQQDGRVIPTGQACFARVGHGLLGRVIDGAGKPLDGKGPIEADEQMPLNGMSINPLARTPISRVLDVGVKAINTMTQVGQGQRLGLFAGSGVGKSVLLGMMTRYTSADIVVVGLIGERGREINEFVQKILGKEGLSRSVVVAAPADHPPLLRLHGAMLATSIAEYFREQGLNVLLLIDSLTRFAQAQREIALAINEPPATKGYPPSVFAKLPHLVERAGNSSSDKGSITAFYTVLTEGDDHNDPISDAARAILDGHIMLSRDLAENGHYPAIDISASVSRVMTDIATREQLLLTRKLKKLYAIYERNRDLINIGAYTAGSDSRIDLAIALHQGIMKFLSQDMTDAVNSEAAFQALANLLKDTPEI